MKELLQNYTTKSWVIRFPVKSNAQKILFIHFHYQLEGFHSRKLFQHIPVMKFIYNQWNVKCIFRFESDWRKNTACYYSVASFSKLNAAIDKTLQIKDKKISLIFIYKDGLSEMNNHLFLLAMLKNAINQVEIIITNNLIGD